jgi:hypothetical protein
VICANLEIVPSSSCRKTRKGFLLWLPKPIHYLAMNELSNGMGALEPSQLNLRPIFFCRTLYHTRFPRINFCLISKAQICTRVRCDGRTSSPCSLSLAFLKNDPSRLISREAPSQMDGPCSRVHTFLETNIIVCGISFPCVDLL